MGYINNPSSYTALTELQLRDRVKNIMDELDQETIQSVGVDVNYPVTTLITKLLPESRFTVLYNAPLLMLPKVEKVYTHSATVGDNVVTEVPALEAGSFRLPDDAIRLVDVNYATWVKPATEFSAPTSQKAVRQGHTYARATVKNPGVSLVDGTTMYAFPYTKVSDAYGSLTLHYISSGTPYTSLGEKAQDALCWDCASRVFSAMGMAEQATICKKHYEEIIK